ncbi:MAG: transporter [Gammaproteobacteria bacterium]|nr:transporter [Gammaproteobacteria bacterium]
MSRPGKVSAAAAVIIVVVTALYGAPASAQDLEPRRWTPLPPGMEVVGIGVGVTQGDVLFDPALQIEDAEVEAEGAALSYVSAFRLGGKLARFDAVLPWQHTRYTGLLAGEPATTGRVGLADPMFRLSVILGGAQPDPAASSQTVFGAAIAVVAPFGEYDSNRLINLGQNRWILAADRLRAHAWAVVVRADCLRLLLYGQRRLLRQHDARAGSPVRDAGAHHLRTPETRPLAFCECRPWRLRPLDHQWQPDR